MKNKSERKGFTFKASKKVNDSSVPLEKMDGQNKTDPKAEAKAEEITKDVNNSIETVETLVIGPEPTTEIKQNSEGNTIIITETTTTSTPLNNNPDEKAIEEIVEDQLIEANSLPEEAEAEEEEELELNDSELLEQAILDSIEKIIQEDLYELEQIEFDLAVLAKREEEEITTDEIDKIRKELEDLLKKFEEIRRRYEQSNQGEILDLDDKYLYSLISDYKDTIESNTLLSEMNDNIQHIEEYVSVIERIIQTEKSVDDLEQKLDDKKEALEIRDEEFEALRKEYEDIERVTANIEVFAQEQDKLLAEIEEKIEYSEDIQTRIDKEINLVPDLNRLLNATLMFAAAGNTPPTPRGYLLKTSLIIGAIRNASQFLRTEEKSTKVTTIKYTNYAKEVKASIGSIDDIIDMIENTSIDISYMRDTFEKECSEYQGLIPEYDELLRNLDDAEKQIETNKFIILKYRDDFEKTLEKNNAKVKRLEEMSS